MRRLLRAGGIAVLSLSACNYTEGECWIDSQDGDVVGAGGGPIGPGWGGFGDAPPTPQGTTGIPAPDCNVASNTCEGKCSTDYVRAAESCASIKDATFRQMCNDEAYINYRRCRQGCSPDKTDCKERCKKQCDKIHDRCHADCTKNDPTQACHAKCNEEYAQCLRECDKDC